MIVSLLALGWLGLAHADEAPEPLRVLFLRDAPDGAASILPAPWDDDARAARADDTRAWLDVLRALADRYDHGAAWPADAPGGAWAARWRRGDSGPPDTVPALIAAHGDPVGGPLPLDHLALRGGFVHAPGAPLRATPALLGTADGRAFERLVLDRVYADGGDLEEDSGWAPAVGLGAALATWDRHQAEHGWLAHLVPYDAPLAGLEDRFTRLARPLVTRILARAAHASSPVHEDLLAMVAGWDQLLRPAPDAAPLGWEAPEDTQDRLPRLSAREVDVRFLPERTVLAMLSELPEYQAPPQDLLEEAFRRVTEDLQDHLRDGVGRRGGRDGFRDLDGASLHAWIAENAFPGRERVLTEEVPRVLLDLLLTRLDPLLSAEVSTALLADHLFTEVERRVRAQGVSPLTATRAALPEVLERHGLVPERFEDPPPPPICPDLAAEAAPVTLDLLHVLPDAGPGSDALLRDVLRAGVAPDRFSREPVEVSALATVPGGTLLRTRWHLERGWHLFWRLAARDPLPGEAAVPTVAALCEDTVIATRGALTPLLRAWLGEATPSSVGTGDLAPLAGLALGALLPDGQGTVAVIAGPEDGPRVAALVEVGPDGALAARALAPPRAAAALDEVPRFADVALTLSTGGGAASRGASPTPAIPLTLGVFHTSHRAGARAAVHHGVDVTVDVLSGLAGAPPSVAAGYRVGGLLRPRPAARGTGVASSDQILAGTLPGPRVVTPDVRASGRGAAATLTAGPMARWTSDAGWAIGGTVDAFYGWQLGWGRRSRAMDALHPRHLVGPFLRGEVAGPLAGAGQGVWWEATAGLRFLVGVHPLGVGGTR